MTVEQVSQTDGSLEAVGYSVMSDDGTIMRTVLYDLETGTVTYLQQEYMVL